MIHYNPFNWKSINLYWILFHLISSPASFRIISIVLLKELPLNKEAIRSFDE
jgi:hypothetical protein